MAKESINNFYTVIMELFVRKCKIFISHKRHNGEVSTETRLIKRELDVNRYKYRTFLDIHEDHLDYFPFRLKEEIENCNVFLWVVPEDGDVSFLLDKNNWVRKEIQTALVQRLLKGNNYKILPVAINRNLNWSKYSDAELGEIAEIKNYDIKYLNISGKNISTELYESIGYKIKNNLRIRNFFFVIFLLLFLLGFIATKIWKKYEFQQKKEKIEMLQQVWKGQHKTQLAPIVLTDSISQLFSSDLDEIRLSIDSFCVLIEEYSNYQTKWDDDIYSKELALDFLESTNNIFNLTKRIDDEFKYLGYNPGAKAILSLFCKPNQKNIEELVNNTKRDVERVTPDSLSGVHLAHHMEELSDFITNNAETNIAECYRKIDYFYYNDFLWNHLNNKRQYYCLMYKLYGEMFKIADQYVSEQRKENPNFKTEIEGVFIKKVIVESIDLSEQLFK